ncbi:TIGR02206 family membrane protein [Virgibacillus sp. MSP4-1]|uniref:YwaF family protein n=1 Tax=Virgibacillus sp. MSP4-1 TaxID=2700081 RepID=UPI0003A1204A|nr:TIGR02206 family membrane protein [Virgibacillus sp. MSP4-1]QHS22065.1 TIGR02206 family membrane protein [Virgibacillus sp. MSP4-1]
MFVDYFSYENPGDPFSLFSASHLIMLGIGVLFVITFVVFGKYIRNHSLLHTWVRYILIAVLLLSEATLNLWYLTAGEWDVRETLPLQLCSLSLLMSMVMLVTRSEKWFEIVYFLGIGGALQALMTPELFYDFPHYRYFHFFIAHIFIILASIYMIVVEKKRVTIHSVWRTMLVLNGIAVVIFFFNRWIGANYMFLAHKPANPSLLDYLPEFPWYILWLEIIAAFIFLLLYLPFLLIKKRDSKDI